MSSWYLLRQLLSFWRATDNPVFMHAIRRPPVWYGAYTQLARATGALLVVGGLACYGFTLLVFLLNNVLVLILPLLLIWALMIGVTLGPVIAGERQRGTWVVLRTTPLALDGLVIGKTSGALWWLRDPIRAMIGLLWLIAIAIGLVSMIVTPATGAGGDPLLSERLLCVGAVVLPVLSALIYVAERGQQFALMIVGGLAISASTRTVRGALTGASMVTLGIWVADASIAASLILLHPGDSMLTVGNWFALLTLGPVVGYLSTLPASHGLIAVAVTLVLREIAIRFLWRWTLRRAAEM